MHYFSKVPLESREALDREATFWHSEEVIKSSFWYLLSRCSENAQDGQVEGKTQDRCAARTTEQSTVTHVGYVTPARSAAVGYSGLPPLSESRLWHFPLVELPLARPSAFLPLTIFLEHRWMARNNTDLIRQVINSEHMAPPRQLPSRPSTSLH